MKNMNKKFIIQMMISVGSIMLALSIIPFRISSGQFSWAIFWGIIYLMHSFIAVHEVKVFLKERKNRYILPKYYLSDFASKRIYAAICAIDEYNASYEQKGELDYPHWADDILRRYHITNAKLLT